MTDDRKKQVEESAKELADKKPGPEDRCRYCDSFIYGSFIAGAEWADENNTDAILQFELTKKNKDLEAKLKVAVEALEKLTRYFGKANPALDNVCVKAMEALEKLK